MSATIRYYVKLAWERSTNVNNTGIDDSHAWFTTDRSFTQSSRNNHRHNDVLSEVWRLKAGLWRVHDRRGRKFPIRGINAELLILSREMILSAMTWLQWSWGYQLTVIRRRFRLLDHVVRLPLSVRTSTALSVSCDARRPRDLTWRRPANRSYYLDNDLSFTDAHNLAIDRSTRRALATMERLSN